MTFRECFFDVFGWFGWSGSCDASTVQSASAMAEAAWGSLRQTSMPGLHQDGMADSNVFKQMTLQRVHPQPAKGRTSSTPGVLVASAPNACPSKQRAFAVATQATHCPQLVALPCLCPVCVRRHSRRQKGMPAWAKHMSLRAHLTKLRRLNPASSFHLFEETAQ